MALSKGGAIGAVAGLAALGLALYTAAKDGYFRGLGSGAGDGGSIGGAEQQQAANNPTVVGLTSPTQPLTDNQVPNNVQSPITKDLSQSPLFQPAVVNVPLNQGGSVRLNESTYNPITGTGTDYLGQGFSRAPNALDKAVIYVNRNTGVSIDPILAAKSQNVSLGTENPPPLTTQQIAQNLISGVYASSQPQSIALNVSSPVAKSSSSSSSSSSSGGSKASATLSASTLSKSQGTVSKISSGKIVVTTNKSKINYVKR